MLSQEAIVEQMRAYMEQNQLTQKEIAKKIGVSSVSVCQWLKGNRNMKYNHAAAVMELIKSEGKQNGNGKIE